MRISMDMRACDETTTRSIRPGYGKHWAVLAMLCAFEAAGATTPATNATGADARRLAEVSAVAGKPVSSFRYMDQATFEPIGLSDLLVFTTPREAWLLHLDGPCRDLDFGPFLKLTSHMHRVSTLSDSVIVRDNPIPCRIREIRPVDATTLRQIDKEKSAQDQQTGATDTPVK